MLHPSTRKLIDRLAEMTELGKLEWTEGDGGNLIYSTEGYSVCLPDGAGEVVIQSINGKELERAAVDALAATTSDDGASYTQIVAGMKAEAARIARGTETAISSLLAGMAEPDAPAEAPAADLTDHGPEDPGDEVAAMESEGIANHQVQATPEPEPEIEAADDAPAIAPVATEAEAESQAETETDDAEQTPEAVMLADTSEQTSAEAEATIEDVSEIEASGDEPADEIDTESDVTAAVARLADEVNNRDDDEDPEVTSAVGAAAATAVGVVASAAGLDQEEEAEAPDAADVEHATEQALPGTPTAAEAAAPVYVPFGLDQDDDTPAPAALETTPEASVTAPADVPSTPEEFSGEATAPATAFVSVPDTETTPDIAEPTVSDFDLPTAAASVAESDPEAAPAMANVEVESAPEPVIESEPEIETVPVAEVVSSSESEPSEVQTPAPEPETTFATAETMTPAIEADTPASDPSDSEPESEPVLAAPEAPKTYSLSGIGAGFGLGALAAKTEASGIPGPSSAAPAEPEKIVIDATEDVLPELEGNLNVEQMEAAVSEISFGKSAPPAAEEEAASDEEADGDILKPRTRFNPWD